MQNTNAIFTQRNTLVRQKPGNVIDERDVIADKKNVPDVLVVFEQESCFVDKNQRFPAANRSKSCFPYPARFSLFCMSCVMIRPIFQ